MTLSLDARQPATTSRGRRQRSIDAETLNALHLLASGVRGGLTGLNQDDTPYTKRLKLIRNLWGEFRTKVLREQIFDPRDPLSQIPTHEQIKGFLAWLLLTGTGRFEQHVTTTTLSKYLNLLAANIVQRHGPNNALPSTLTNDLNRSFIRKELVGLGASLRARRKSVAGTDVVLDMIHYLWALDEEEYHHPRERLQLGTLLLRLLYTGARPGELVASAEQAKARRTGILYKDVTFFLVKKDGKRRFVVKLRVDRKGNDKQESKDMTFVLLDDIERRNACPVALLIGLALADCAFQRIRTVDDLRKLKVKKTVTVKEIKVMPSMMEVPVFRSTRGRGQEYSENSMLDYSRLLTLISGLAERAGYAERVTPYNIRRGHGGVLDRNVSAAVRQKRMGHSNAATFQHYISRVSNVDGQSLMLGRRPEVQLMDFFQSVATSIDLDVPRPPGSSLTDPRRENGQVSRLRYQQTRKAYQNKPFRADVDDDDDEEETEDENENDDDGSDDYDDAASARVIKRPGASQYLDVYLKWDKPRAELIRLFYQTRELGLEDTLPPLLDLARLEHSHWRYDCITMNEDGRCPSCGRMFPRQAGRSYDNQNRHFLLCFLKKQKENGEARLRKEIATTYTSCCWSDCQHHLVPTSSKSTKDTKNPTRCTLQSVAKHLHRHVTDDTRQCRWSGCNFGVLTSSELILHLLREHSVPLPDTLPEYRYCYRCRILFGTALEWTHHCAGHLDAVQDKYCGQISRRGVIVWESICMFCLGDDKLPPIQRWRPFSKIHDLHSHFHHCHLPNIVWPTACPHPLCDVRIISAHDFWEHQRDCHGIEPYQKRPGRKVCAKVPEGPKPSPKPTDNSEYSDSSVIEALEPSLKSSRDRTSLVPLLPLLPRPIPLAIQPDTTMGRQQNISCVGSKRGASTLKDMNEPRCKRTRMSECSYSIGLAASNNDHRRPPGRENLLLGSPDLAGTDRSHKSLDDSDLGDGQSLRQILMQQSLPADLATHKQNARSDEAEKTAFVMIDNVGVDLCAYVSIPG